jgi:phage terminase large subunit-like protein
MIQISPDDFYRIIVGVDPAITSGEDADETGIIVVASGPHQPDTCSIATCTMHGYVLEDATPPKSNKNSVDLWVNIVVEKFDEWNANLVVVEGNAGRELLDMALRTVRPDLPISRPNARENKKARAEPIVALYEQGRVHHVGSPEQFAQLEEQMTTWVPKEGGGRAHKSPDRVDALVWGLAELNLQGRKPRRAIPEIAPVGFGQLNGWRV